ncbi:putative FBD-associated F-box protein At5g22720 isoform X1 [Triticum dicoccoides]|uniref:putative FBD-associated F-box protein At5g22720 isoform X1 n=1 Tax=Triticum dicoccoides TaxID=85692 RepID=UPI00188FC91A|nr:putative FBD-associated F-box protein At5g22720 isoform X1 [Triticum dicoccoides]
MAGRTPFTNVDPETAAYLRRLGIDPHELDRATEQLLTYICVELLPAPPVSDAPRRSIFSRLLITEAAHEPALPASADLISVLPDTLLRNIVSRLPIADAARTAVLASRWRRVWLSTEPVLIDAFLRPSSSSVTAAVSGILESHPGPFRRVHLTCSHMSAHQAQLARWLQLLAAKGVHDLVLVNRPWPCDVPLPDALFSISSVVRLYIGLWKLPDTAGLRGAGASFPHLRELGICTVAMGEGDVDSMVASSPVLEILSIQGSHKGLRLRIVSQSLRCVQICSSVVENVTVVKAPRLERLILQGGRHAASGLCTMVSILDAPKLHSFGFLEPGNHVLGIGDTVIMAGIKESAATTVASVKILSLNVRFGVPNEARMVPMFLKCFPNVVRLHIMSRKCNRSAGKLSLNFQEGPTESAMLHIKEMHFREFRGEQGEVAFLKSIFPKVLETAVIIMANPSFTPFSVAVAFSELKEASEVIRCCQVLLLKSAGPEGGKAWSFKEGSDFSCEDPFSTVESSIFTPEQSKFIGFDESRKQA